MRTHCIRLGDADDEASSTKTESHDGLQNRPVFGWRVLSCCGANPNMPAGIARPACAACHLSSQTFSNRQLL
jgi:hypothetical protein